MTTANRLNAAIDRLSVWLIREAAAVLPTHREWGKALEAEVPAVEGSAARLRFAVACSFALLRTAALNACRGRIADPASTSLAFALGCVTAIVDLQSGSRSALRLMLGVGCFALGVMTPRAAWRWGVWATLGLPVVIAITRDHGPYTYDRADVWLPLLPCIALALLGASIRRLSSRRILMPALLLGLASVTSSADAQAAVRPASHALTRQDLAAFADSIFASYMRRYAEPSLALIVVHGDSVFFQRGYGFEDARSRRPVDPDSTLFNIASISKLITATAAMQLVERGKLELDRDVNSYLPEDRRIEPGARPITLRQLLSHTSGLDGPFMRDVVARPELLVPLATYFAMYPARRGRPPGEIRYSNHGMALAGHIVELVAGGSLAGYADSSIFGALGMRRSTFVQPPPPALAARVATAGSGPVPNALLPYPAGSMVSTAADMGRFMHAHLNGGLVHSRTGSARILADSTVRRMHARQWSAEPRLPGVALGFFESDLGGEQGLFHTGARTHFSLLYLLPERRVGIFLVHSMRQGGEFRTLRTDFVRGFAHRYFGNATVARAGRRPLHPHSAARFAGVYRPILFASTTIERAARLGTDTRVTAHDDGSLSIAIPGGPRLQLVEIDSGLFRVSYGPEQGTTVAFTTDGDGSVGRMALAGNTQDPVSFERLAWYERGKLHASLLAGAFLLFLSCAVTGVVRLATFLIHRWRGRQDPVEPPPQRWAWRAAVLTSALVVLAPISVAAIVLTHTGDDTAADNLRFGLTVGLTLLLVGATLGATLVPFAIHAQRRRYWSPARRAYYLMLAIAGMLSLPLLGYYNLLGYRF
ncbi:MAG: beta-lactamase family protein [Gemmatimonadota bacterium]|nr:beta-lactamase family protein [Gemmatimonadota bacterium]